MNKERPRPPLLATWLLRHLSSRADREALTGDLWERFEEGESKGWFWRQVWMAILVGARRELRTHWPEVSFAAVGAPVLWLWGGRFIGMALGNPIVARAWSWGFSLEGAMPMAYDLAFRSCLAAVMIQPLLAAMLLLGGGFRWIKLVRSMLISIPLIAVTALVWELWSLRFSSPLFFVPLMLATLLVSAGFGCRTAGGSAMANDGVLLATRAALTGMTVMYVLHEVSGIGNGSSWVLDQLNRPLVRAYAGWGISRHIVVPVEVLLVAVGCGWIARRWNRRYYRTMLTVLAISWTALFGYMELTYWSKVVGDAMAHPWFRAYLADYAARFLLAIAGILLGGWLSRPGLRARLRARGSKPPGPTPAGHAPYFA